MESTSISSLPPELIAKIGDNLGAKDISNFSKTNGGLNLTLQNQLKDAALSYAFAPPEFYANAFIFENGHAALDENMAFRTPDEPMVKAIWEDNADAVRGFLDVGVRVDEYSIHAPA